MTDVMEQSWISGGLFLCSLIPTILLRDVVAMLIELYTKFTIYPVLPWYMYKMSPTYTIITTFYTFDNISCILKTLHGCFISALWLQSSSHIYSVFTSSTLCVHMWWLYVHVRPCHLRLWPVHTRCSTLSWSPSCHPSVPASHYTQPSGVPSLPARFIATHQLPPPALPLIISLLHILFHIWPSLIFILYLRSPHSSHSLVLSSGLAAPNIGSPS